MEGKEKLGTEVIESFIDIFAGIIAKSLKAMEDKHITVAEGFSLAFEIPKVIKAVKDVPEFVEQIKDIDPEEGAKLLSLVYKKYQELSEK